MSKISVNLKVWRQAGINAPGGFFTYQAKDISTDMSFLEMLDVVNERLIESGDLPILLSIYERHRRIDANQRHVVFSQCSQLSGCARRRSLERAQETLNMERLSVRHVGG